MKKPTKKLNILRLLAVFTVCLILICSNVLSVSAVESGACGEGTMWVLDAGTLSITGKGDMKNYRDSELAPWYEFRNQIVRVEIADTVTSIGSFAFYGCKNLVSVHIPNSVRTIGSYAFASCERMTSVQIGGSVSSIGDGAFYNCYALESVRLPYGLSNLGSQAFYRCESLRAISVPSDVRTMGHSVFAYCKSLVRAEINARISELPEWTFYGCAQLSEVSLAETIKSVGNFGFKKCDSLSNVYYPGTEKDAKALKEDITEDVSSFEFTGYIADEEIPSSSSAGEYIEYENDIVVQRDIMVLQNSRLVMSCTVDRTYKRFSSNKGTYVANIVLTVENEEYWELATEQVFQMISQVHKTYAEIANLEKLTVTVYLVNDVKISNVFLNSLAGRTIYLSVHLSNGSSWSMNCKDLKVSEIEDSSVKDYSYTLKEASPEIQENLGTDDCYRLVFDETTTQNAEVVVQLPTETAVHTNAYLYQIEEDGSYTKLQATAVDNNGCAHFYIGSSDEYVDYVIGLDVPGEDTNDVIIPDELVPPSNSTSLPSLPSTPSTPSTPSVPGSTSSALERLEEITFVETARDYSEMGFGYGGLTWILIGVLVATTIVVGGIMLMWNKSRKSRLNYAAEAYVDDYEEYDAE